MRFHPVLLISIMCVLNSCADRETFTEKSFVIRNKQTITVNQLDLSITNNGCGRHWVNEDGKPGIERPFCEIKLKRGDKTAVMGNDFKPVYIGNLLVQLEKINPWQREEDSIPPGGCKVLVKLLDSR